MRTLLFCTIFLFYLNAALADDSAVLLTASKSHEWEILLHYEKGIFGNNRSLVDDENFFLSKNGKYNPYAEITALNENIFIQGLRGEGSAVCRFPLRAEFLAKTLNKPLSELNFEECTDLQSFMKEVNPVKASIIFPFYHMNGPASMFGHTLIRFDSDLESKLVSTAITYAADFNGTDGGFTYAVKGVTGLYAGRSQILPYHRKIREYDNINQRDIWEYELNLTPDEVRKMALHSYEIKDTWSRYYFFDENCAYNLLFIIEAGKPETNLTGGFLWVIPADTIYVMKQKNLLGKTVFRPSQSYRMAEMLKQMNKRSYDVSVSAIDTGKLQVPNDFSDDEKVRILDFWIEYTQFSNRKNDVNEYTKEVMTVLRQRAAIPIKKTYEYPIPADPLQAHRPSKITATAGGTDGKMFGELRWRPALHTPDDSDVGFLEGSTLAFFDITVRKEEGKDFYLKKLSLVDIYSISPVTEIFNPISWKVNFGLEHLYEENSTAAFLNPGAGKAFKVGGGLLYGLFNTKVRASTGYNEGYSAGAGLEAGFIKSFENFKISLKTDAIRYGLGHDRTEGTVRADINYFISNKASISAGIKNGLFDDKKDDFSLSFALYF